MVEMEKEKRPGGCTAHCGCRAVTAGIMLQKATARLRCMLESCHGGGVMEVPNNGDDRQPWYQRTISDLSGLHLSSPSV